MLNDLNRTFIEFNAVKLSVNVISVSVYAGKLIICDLAGSERLKSTHSTGRVLQEAGFINKSLYVLGKVNIILIHNT